jgi:NADP-dependent 3-hydroxy acid dehydrogenase YdfG
LVLVACDEAKLREVEQQVIKINPAVKTLRIALDITDAVAVEAMFKKTQEKYGRSADILIANAGVNAATNGGGPVLHEAPVDYWWRNFVSWVDGILCAEGWMDADTDG